MLAGRSTVKNPEPIERQKLATTRMRDAFGH
jgi:hypothetical protein